MNCQSWGGLTELSKNGKDEKTGGGLKRYEREDQSMKRGSQMRSKWICDTWEGLLSLAEGNG